MQRMTNLQLPFSRIALGFRGKRQRYSSIKVDICRIIQLFLSQFLCFSVTLLAKTLPV